MIFLLVFIFSIIEYYEPTQGSIVHMQNSIRKLAAIDEELGERSDSISSSLNSALNLNLALRGFHLACLPALKTGTLPALEALARGVVLTQTVFLVRARIESSRLNLFKYQKEYNPPKRGLPRGICQLPDTLNCESEVAFKFKHRDDALPAGTYAEYNNCKSLAWNYKDERVRPL
jgi:hypothetical protein